MKAGFYYLDFKENKLLGPMTPKEICVTGKMLKQHPEDFEIVMYHRLDGIHAVTKDFYCHRNGYWKHNPLRPVNAAKATERLVNMRRNAPYSRY